LVTENGFSIVRVCELVPGSSDSASECHFIVGSNGGVRSIKVEFNEAAIALVQAQRESSTPLSLTSSFWLHCAERHLATYLWENDGYPPNGRLMVDWLTAEDLGMVLRFE
jgi:hypothetical protein